MNDQIRMFDIVRALGIVMLCSCVFVCIVYVALSAGKWLAGVI